jgi:hypothetical protein
VRTAVSGLQTMIHSRGLEGSSLTSNTWLEPFYTYQLDCHSVSDLATWVSKLRCEARPLFVSSRPEVSAVTEAGLKASVVSA